MKNKSWIYTIVFTASLSCLAFEITLTRIFSISLWYHFAFMIISIAMLGLALSGTILSVFPKLKNILHVDVYCLLLGVSISASYLVSNHIPFDPIKFQWSKTQFLYIGCYYLILLFPFFFTGLIAATAFHSMSKNSGILYAADLIGAAVGSAGVLFLLNNLRPEQVIFLLTMTVMLLTLFSGRKPLKIISLVIMGFVIIPILLKSNFTTVRISPYKEMSQALYHPNSRHLKTFYDAFSRVDIFESPAVRFAPGLSLTYQDPLPRQLGCSIDGDNVMAITSVFEKDKLKFLAALPAALAFETGLKNDVLIIDPGGGLPTLMAGFYQAKNIHNIESNTLLTHIIEKHYGNFTGHMYRSNTVTGMGRSWLKARSQNYDIIDISLTKSIPAGLSGLSEDHQLTVETFQEYFSHLKTGGILSLNLYILPPPRQSFRLLTTILEAMRRSGIENPASHISAIRSWSSINIMVKKTPFTQEEIKKIKNFSYNRMFDLITYPGIQPEESNIFIRTEGNLYFNSFSNIIQSQSRNSFIRKYIFDITPVYDDKPFFYYFLKFKNIKEIYKLTGQKWDFFIREGYLLPFILIQVILLGLILIFMPFYIKNRKVKNRQMRLKNRSILLFFASLGIGFMFVEIALVQKFILLFTTPQYAVAWVLSSILVGAGSGSFFSSRHESFRRPFMILVIPVVIILTILAFPGLSVSLLVFPLSIRLVLILAFCIPVGFFLGIPFPMGIKLLGARQANLIPWAWAINGFFSVLGPILTMMIALSYGFSTVLWLSALVYVLAFFAFRIYQKGQ